MDIRGGGGWTLEGERVDIRMHGHYKERWTLEEEEVG